MVLGALGFEGDTAGSAVAMTYWLGFLLCPVVVLTALGRTEPVTLAYALDISASAAVLTGDVNNHRLTERNLVDADSCGAPTTIGNVVLAVALLPACRRAVPGLPTFTHLNMLKLSAAIQTGDLLSFGSKGGLHPMVGLVH